MNLSDRATMRNRRSNLSETVAYALLLSGVIALVASIVYSSSILAFIGLSLTFWGALLLYIKPTKYVKASLLDTAAVSSLTSIDQIITELNYEGKAIYLPPRFVKELKGAKVFIPSKKDAGIPPAEEIAEEKVFLKNPKGICLTPPGLGLVNLYENKLGKDFAKVDLNYLQNNLPKLFIEDLEIAEDLEINVENDRIKAKITGSIYKDFCKEAGKLSNICGSFGCPLCSSIAIALTRASGKPIIIEKTELPKDSKTIEASYRVLETTEKQIEVAPAEAYEPFKPIARPLSYLIQSLLGPVLTVFGTITLAWVGWLTWYDITTWKKSLALIFFGSRTTEAISLGMGMRLIYYLLIGSALFLSGIVMFLRKRRRKQMEE